jgi:PLP dependent protein
MQTYDTIVERFDKIKSNILLLKPIKPVTIIAVSKTFKLSHIQPLIDYGHNHYGENKVQEALAKWSEIRKKNKSLSLHMIGKLQSNKVKNAVQIFDYIHSLDNQRLADILSKTQSNLNRKLKYFIQVNIGNELQKSGIPVNELDSFYNYCKQEKKLEIVGLMVIPPNDKETNKYFKSLNELNNSLALKHLSMGMSADYADAINCGATFVRIGSSIFGARS